MPILKPYVCIFTKFCPVLSKQHHKFSDMQTAISDVKETLFENSTYF